MTLSKKKKVTIYYSKTEDPVKTMLSLDLSGNKFSEELNVNLGWNKIHGILPEFSMFLKLETLVLSGNQLKGGVPKSLQNASYLRSLMLSNISLSGDLPLIIHNLSRYMKVYHYKFVI